MRYFITITITNYWKIVHYNHYTLFHIDSKTTNREVVYSYLLYGDATLKLVPITSC